MTFNSPQQNILPEELDKKVRAAEAWLHEMKSQMAKAEESKVAAEQASAKAQENYREKVAQIEKEMASLLLIKANALREKSDVDNSIKEAKALLVSLNKGIEEARSGLTAVLKEFEEAKPKLEAEKTRLAEKEKAIDVYASSLKLKEEKIAQYLNIFERLGREIKL